MQAYHPVDILDPGPDGITRNVRRPAIGRLRSRPFDVRQRPLPLTNPPDLRMLNTGLLAEVRSQWRSAQIHASFLAEKSYGPTNPGYTVLENDPYVIGPSCWIQT
jgi:hypothetical protein